MSIRAVLSCNGMEGAYPCRQATPVGEVLTAAEARAVAKKYHGWSTRIVARAPSTEYKVEDLCQRCARQELER